MSSKAGLAMVLAMGLASCGGPAVVRNPDGSPVVHQVWDVVPDGDGCAAVQLCYGELSAPCDPAPPAQDQTVLMEPYACPGGRTTLQIGQLRGSRACVILPAGTERVDCPAPSPSAWYPGEGEPEEAEPEDTGVEFSVSAARNLEKGQAALARKDLAAARAYFDFVQARFPLSSMLHDAERGLLAVETAAAKGGAAAGAVAESTCLFVDHHPTWPQVVSGELRCPAGTARSPGVHADELAKVEAEANRAAAAGEIDADTTNDLCLFIAHHPTFPQVANGDVACRVNRIQGIPCEPGQTTAPRYCPSP